MRVPFSDISFDKDEIEAVSSTLRVGWPSRGKVSELFEAELGKYLNSHVALVNSGSSALLCALLAYGVKAGDTVLVPDFTFIATASIPALLGARIVPVDCKLDTFNIDDEAKELYEPHQLLTFTDVAGLPNGANFPEPVRAIEDAAEALGSEENNRKIGSGEHLTCFSFNATKSLSTVEGGAVASKNEELIEKVRSVSNYGRTSEQYVHDRLGLNCRITDMQSALGLISLKKLDKNLARRKEIADRYRRELPQFQFQKVPSYVTRSSNYWAIALVDNRNEVLEKFQHADIDARPPFKPISRQPCFRELWRTEGYNNADMVSINGLCLPIFNTMTNEQVDRVIEVGNN